MAKHSRAERAPAITNQRSISTLCLTRANPWAPASFCLVQVTNRAWRKSRCTPFLHKGSFRFSLTHTLSKNSIRSKFRYLEARLPLLSPFAVSIGQAPHRAPTGQNLSGSYSFCRAGPYRLFDVQVLVYPRRQRFQATSLQPDSLHAGWNIALLKKENHHV
jgi:hypothetical protein